MFTLMAGLGVLAGTLPALDLPGVHLHVSFLAAMLTMLEFFIAWIPVKIIAAHFSDRSSLAGAVLHVL